MNKNTISSADWGDMKLRLRKDLVFHVVFQNEMLVEMDHIEAAQQFITENSSHHYFINLLEFKDFSTVDKNVRAWASKKENRNTKSLADVIVFSTLPQKMIVDFYLEFCNPYKPTKAFRSLEKAEAWIDGSFNDKALVGV